MIFAHQANEFIISRLRNKLNMDSDKFPSTVITNMEIPLLQLFQCKS